MLKYSDSTPTTSPAHNRAGRQVRAEDAAGVTTFAYDDFGAVTNETVVGVAGTNTIERFYDSFGRDAGYALNGVRQSTLAYDPATGRLATMLAAGSDMPFMWNYLPGSDIKSSLAYPNGLTASWQYDANNQLLQVRNAFPTNTISQYDYVYDAAGRRVQISRSGSAMSENRTDVHGYNSRGELTSAVKQGAVPEAEYAYEYDDIGNRLTSLDLGTNRTYVANNLNQYTQISNLCDSASLREEFLPQFDDDGNQTLIKTATGIWQVQYNGENRPVLWEKVTANSPTPNSSTPTLLSMSYDRMGRRVTKNAQRFVYDGYLQIANFEIVITNSQLTTHNSQLFIWDPTEPVATRPLVWNSSTFQPFNFSNLYYTHDGNKNVSEVVSFENELSAHYEYSPFGAEYVVRGDKASEDPWRFSSEYADDEMLQIYYNYRHYEPSLGRWCCRDMLEEEYSLNLSSYCSNGPSLYYDALGNSWLDFSPGEPPAEVGFGEGLIPIYGSLREFDCATYNGEWGKASFHAVMAISDVCLVRSLIGAVGKGCWKRGAHTWSATRKWYAKHYGVEKGAEVHHMYIPQAFIRKHKWVEPIANQPWNLKVFRQTSDLSAKKFHLAVHGCRVSASDSMMKVELSLLEQYWYRYYSTGAMSGFLYFADDLRLTVSIIKDTGGNDLEFLGADSAVDVYDNALKQIEEEITDESLDW